MEIALVHKITADDAAYPVLSARLGIFLVTADERLARALAGAPFEIRPLNPS